MDGTKAGCKTAEVHQVTLDVGGETTLLGNLVQALLF